MLMLGSAVLLMMSLASGVLELRIELAPPSQGLAVSGAERQMRELSRRTVPGTLRRERRPELGPGRLMIVISDAAGGELDRRTIADPRIIRIESPDATGLFSGQTIRRDATELRFVIPNFVDAARVRIYQLAGDVGATVLVGEIELSR